VKRRRRRGKKEEKERGGSAEKGEERKLRWNKGEKCYEDRKKMGEEEK
jgi:hypothetical protein